MAPIVRIAQHKSDTTIADKNKVFENGPKKGPIALREVYGDIIEEPPTDGTRAARSPTTGGPPGFIRRTTTRSTKTAMLNDILDLCTSWKGKYDSQRESELDEKVLSVHKRHDCHSRAQDSGTESDSSVDRHGKS